MVDPNHSLWIVTSQLTALRLHMILTKTSEKTDKSSSCQEISLSPDLIFRTTDAILFRDVLPVLQSDWIAVCAANELSR